ncbi:hypothetical protein [Shinella zoogloeoides]|nr:hypothetical protein [Shinella zoogloeoides]WLR92974.1 hypothetical protein Q9316_01825 [Shinella zoogloeoides]
MRFARFIGTGSITEAALTGILAREGPGCSPNSAATVVSTP